MRARVAIVGGGIAGLSAAYFLLQRGFDPVVFEAAPTPGGLAGLLELSGGFRIERFYHFICQPDVHLVRLLARLNLQHRLHWRRTRMALFHGGQVYPFGTPLELLHFPPLDLLSRLRVGLHVLRSRRIRHWRELDQVTAVDWLRAELGDNAYHVIWEPLLTMKFGARFEEVSAAWIWSRIARVAKSRKGIRQYEYLGYLQGGTAVLLDALSQVLGPRIRTRSPIEHLVLSGDRVRGIQSAGRIEPFDAVVSTVPLSILARIVPELASTYQPQLSSIDYLGVKCLLLRLRTPFSPYFWTNVSDPSVPFAGAIEYTQLNPMPELGGDSILYVPHYLDPREERYGWELDRVLQAYIPALKRMNPRFDPRDIVEAHLSKAPLAQVICNVGFAERIPPFATPIQGLFLTDSSQLYPEDRVISDLIHCAEQVAALVSQNR